MVADARMFWGAGRWRGPCGAASARDWLASGALGAAVLKMAEDLATLGAAIDLALCEDEIESLDDATIEAILSDEGLLGRDDGADAGGDGEEDAS